MLPDPIHPIIVHFPIVLGVSLPIFAVAALWTIARGRSVRQAWTLPTILAGALTLSAFAALKTGQAQEERVEPVVGEAPIHGHEEAAELFLILSGATFVLTGAGLLGGGLGKGFRYAATASALALVAAGIRVGDSGGDLVYKYGAAQAYVGSSSLATGPDRRLEGARSERGEHEEGERGDRS